MTPEQFEWEQEKLEQAYVKGALQRDEFTFRMTSMGFTFHAVQQLIKDLDAQKVKQ